MSKIREVYRCTHCNLVVEIVNDAAPTPICCGEAMQLLDARSEDAGQEKHVPVVSDVDGGVNVKVGEVEHPMAEDHYIKFIEIRTKEQVLRSELNPGDKPEATFTGISKADVVEVVEFCTTHGLWQA